jgi:hypothetical protein
MEASVIRRSKRWHLVALLLPLLLVGLFFALGPLGASCSEDLLDNPEYDCNLGGNIQWAMWVAVPISIGGALVALLTWPRC